METQSPPQKGGGAPQIFGPCLLWPNGWMDQDATWHEARLSPGDSVLDGDSAPTVPTKVVEQHPIFGPRLLWPNGCMDEDATWYGGKPRPTRQCSLWTQLPPEKKAHPPHPIFGPCLLWRNAWMDEDAAWYESRPRPWPHCTRRGPSSRERGTAAPPLFSAHVYCGHGRPPQLLLSSCLRHSVDIIWCGIVSVVVTTVSSSWSVPPQRPLLRTSSGTRRAWRAVPSRSTTTTSSR